MASKASDSTSNTESKTLTNVLPTVNLPEITTTVQQNVQNGQISAQMNPQEKQKAKHFFTDGLAICGTRNCVQQLAENIQNKVSVEMR